MIDCLKIWVTSKTWFWFCRTWLGKASFFIEKIGYKGSASVSETKATLGILRSIVWIGLKTLVWAVLLLVVLSFVEDFIGGKFGWPSLLSAENKQFSVEQLRLYSQLLTAIFSIYFATTGIILSAGYTRLRSDIIRMLANEQVGSVYSRLLVFSTVFCLVAAAFPLLGVELGLFVYVAGATLTLFSILALFPLGARLFNFFDLKQLAHSEILPKIARHIKGAANRRNSRSLANHHSSSARRALEQLSYIDDRIRADEERVKDNLPVLSSVYTTVLLHYLSQKHTIDQDSYWFPRRTRHKQWFLAGDTATSMALETSSQQMLVEKAPDHTWLENEIVNRLSGHIELAFGVGDFDLALKLIGRFSNRISSYAEQFQFDVGMQELRSFKKIIEQAFISSRNVEGDKKVTIAIADTWAALGSNLCLETLRRMMTFEKELQQFFDADDWSKKSLRRLPAFLQVELSFVVERIEFERDIEGQRLSKPKYVQQLAVQKLLEHYSRILPAVCDFYKNLLHEFVDLIAKLNMSEAATQVTLASLHSYWKLPSWFGELTQLLERYYKFETYSEEQYKLPRINTTEMIEQLASARDATIDMLSKTDLVRHVFENDHNDELPDHFGQIYFELAEVCINALEQNDESKLDKVLPMFLNLAFFADSKFIDSSFEVNEEYRLHLVSTVINDLASVLGFAILYGGYFKNEKLFEGALAKFDAWIAGAADKQQYFKRMVLLSNPHSFSMSASPRSLIRINWKISFEQRARQDGFGDQMGMTRGKQHPNKIVREFLRSHSDPSHLFFAVKVIPELEPVDFKVDYHITELARQLSEDDEEVQDEYF